MGWKATATALIAALAAAAQRALPRGQEAPAPRVVGPGLQRRQL
jgi:hypothetical protein